MATIEHSMAILSMGVAVFCACFFWRTEWRASIAALLSRPPRTVARSAFPPLLSALAGLLDRVGVIVPAMRLLGGGERIALALERAGVASTVDAEGFVVLRIAALICAPPILFALMGPGLGAGLVGIVLGAAAPELMLRRAQRRRREALERALPGAIDHLALLVEAGGELLQSVGRVAGTLPAGPLRSLLRGLERSVRIGLGRREAFEELARRSGSAPVARLATLLIQADGLGTPVGPLLKSAAERLRAE